MHIVHRVHWCVSGNNNFGISFVFACRYRTDKAPSEDVKPILSKHSSIIFYVVYASFNGMEMTIYERCELAFPSLLRVCVYYIYTGGQGQVKCGVNTGSVNLRRIVKFM